MAVEVAPGIRAPWREAITREIITRAALLVALALILLGADALCARVALPVAITRDASGLTVRVGGLSHTIPTQARMLAVALPPRDPVLHEYQLDGTDSTNTGTLDVAYLHSIASTPYYRFYAWMRDLDGLSRWRNVCAQAGGQPARCVAMPPLTGVSIVTSAGETQRVTLELQRPETPASLAVALSDGGAVSLTVDRNSHQIRIVHTTPGQTPATYQAYFPGDAQDLPALAAMTLDYLIHVALWALALLAAISAGELVVGLARGALGMRSVGMTRARATREGRREGGRAVDAGWRAWLAVAWARLTGAIHPLGLALVAVSFVYTVWIALAQYHAQPHIYDASAYLFGAKIFASGRLFAPAPVAADRFPGPFMAILNGRWFPQYEPATSLTLAVGVALGVPWLVEPLLGALSLVGLGLVLRRLYDRRVATLAVALGAASPFYLWLNASYLSHTIGLFYLVWGWWALVSFAQGGRGRLLPLAAALWGMAALTRETSILFIAAAVVGTGWLAWRGQWVGLWRKDWATSLTMMAAVVAILLTAALCYNALLTGNPLTIPRTLIFAGDHWGFGPGVGFYGQHTLAAGFITVDELLTSLAIDLFGWPFYLTLAFLPILWLARRAKATDVVMLAGAELMTFAFLGFYYHGIYLGPRYLFDTLPFLLALTARGIVALGEVGVAARRLGEEIGGRMVARGETAQERARPVWASLTVVALAALIACNALYFFPRQVALHANFTGMPAGTTINTAALSHPPVHHAIVVTADGQLYGYTLFGLNDPLLRGDVLYALADTSAEYAELRRAYPGRSLYVLIIGADGQPQFAPLGDTAATGG